MRDRKARRADRSSERAEFRPDRDDRSRGHFLERSERWSALRSSWAVAWPARIRSGSSSTASLVRSGLRSLQVADHVRAGMEVMSTEDDHW